CLGTTRTMWSALTSTLASRLMSVMRMRVMRSLLGGGEVVLESPPQCAGVPAALQSVVGVVEDSKDVRVAGELRVARISVPGRDASAQLVCGVEGDLRDRASMFLRDVVGEMSGSHEGVEGRVTGLGIGLLLRPCTGVGIPPFRVGPHLLQAADF